jgi:iron complex transport system ATP-binding protein
MSMHELELAQRYADRLLCIRDGRVDRQGSPEEIFSDGYIESLYGLERGSYDSLAGTTEAARIDGAPRVFVIGGGGSGIPVYRRLRRQGIPFAAGVLPENDLDTPTARALAVCVITDRTNEPVSAGRVDEALNVLKSCERVLCTCAFGSVNHENRRLLEYAQAHGLLCGIEALEEMVLQ